FDIISSSAIVTLSGLKITQGNEPAGGGIYNVGTLTVSHCTISHNRGDRGGGIFNDSGGTLTVSHCTLSDNTAIGGGGGIYNAVGATLNVVNHSTISGNSPDDVKNLGTLNQDASSTIGILD